MKAFPIVLPGSRGITTVIGIVVLQDDVANQMAEVGLDKKSKIYCKLCKNNECVHVVFAMCQIEMPKIEPMK